MQNPVPTPSVPSGPGSNHWPRRLIGRYFEALATMSPPSPTMIVSSSTNFAISAQSRSGWIGTSSDSSSGWRMLLVAQLGQPLLVALERLSDRVDQLLQHGPRIAAQADVDGAVLADRLLLVVVDDHGRVLVEERGLAEAQAEVDRRAEDHDHVRAAQRRATRPVALQRVLPRDRAARQLVGVDRRADQLHELLQLLVDASGR